MTDITAKQEPQQLPFWKGRMGMEARRIRSGTFLKTKPAEFFDFFVLFSPQLTLFLHLSSQEWSCSESETWATPQMAAHCSCFQQILPEKSIASIAFDFFYSRGTGQVGSQSGFSEEMQRWLQSKC